MRALSDATPLIHLHRIGSLELLHGLFGTVLVADAVLAELEAGLRVGLAGPALRSLD